MAKVTNRPYTPFGWWPDKKAAVEAAKSLPWRCVPVKIKSGKGGHALCRKDK